MKIGDIKINKHCDKYTWSACAKCGKERWVRIVRGKPKFPCCRSCAEKKPFHREVTLNCPPTSDREAYIKFYGKDLESRFDTVEKTLYKERIFCLDCPDSETCMGSLWKHCPTRVEVLEIIRK